MLHVERFCISTIYTRYRCLAPSREIYQETHGYPFHVQVIMKSTKVQTLGVIRVQLYSSILNNKIHTDRILERRPGKCSSIANFTSIGSSKVDTSTIDFRSSTHRREKVETSHLQRHRISSTRTRPTDIPYSGKF